MKKQINPLKLTEAQFQKQVIDLAHIYGWTVAHFMPAWSKDGQRCRTAVQADGKGFPDLVMVKPREGQNMPRLAFVELKSDTGKLSPEQTEWLKLLAPMAETYCWKPSNWNEIQEIITR